MFRDRMTKLCGCLFNSRRKVFLRNSTAFVFAWLFLFSAPISAELQEAGFLIVKDTETGLFWTKDAANNLSWQDAYGYCINFERDGYTDWAMPSLSQLESLTGKDLSLLWSTDINHWSSDTFYEYGTQRAWLIRLSPYSKNKYETSTVHTQVGVRCVRTGQTGPVNEPPASPRFITAPATVIVDEPLAFEVESGADPNGDSVKIRCSATHSDHPDTSPLIST